MSGVVNIYKEEGLTSHTVVAKVRKILSMKAGHTGTLDPMAEGVLPICLGKATKLAGCLTAHDKSYSAELHLGFTTDTDDTTGKILSEGNPVPSMEEIRRAVESFKGTIFQVPPMYSAIKSQGKRLYELAREGKVIERAPRELSINNIEITGISADNSRVRLEVDCSKGTYIRSLCRDIGETLGCGGCMGKLIRTRSGSFSLETTVKLNELSAEDIIPMEEAYPAPKYTLAAEKYVKPAVNGHPVPIKNLQIQPVTGCNQLNPHRWLYTPNGVLIGLYQLQQESETLRPEVMVYENN